MQKGARYRMPAEWEPHEATWIAWPHFRDDWPGKFHPIPWVYAEIVRHLARHERVEILVNGNLIEQQARKILQDAGALSDSVRFHRCPTNRVWTRDSGPIFVRPEHDDETPADERPSNLVITNWRFNAWAKYDNWQKDNEVPAKISRILKLREVRPATPGGEWVVLEGGSIDVNGRGTLLTTEECLLGPVQQRNPSTTREELESVVSKYLGIAKVIWLGKGIAGDDTHGHVDDIARFVSPDTMVAASETDRADENYTALRDNLERLCDATDQGGKPLRIVALPMPAPVYFEGRRLPASYANFYIANGLVLVPTFNDKNDRLALNILAELFPDRDIVGIYCGDLIWGFGAIHCMTQQQPAT